MTQQLPQPNGDVHVVMLVANDVSNDSRVKKEALAVAETGARVTVIGAASDGRRSIEPLGKALILRIPVAFRLRDERNRGRRRRRTWRPPLLGYRDRAARQARKLEIRGRLDDIKADSGFAVAARKSGAVSPLAYRAGTLGRGLRAARWKLARRGVWVRSGVGSRVDSVFQSGWRAWDGAAARMSWPARWRHVHPETYDYEVAFGDLIDQLAPDIVHAHDMHVVGVAARAAGRAKLRGRDLKVVYDAHEYVPGLSRYGPRTPRFIAAWARHEREYIGHADHVVTVSPAIARKLQDRHGLDHEPSVIINTPVMAAADTEVIDLRSRLRLGPDVPLMVYSGGVTRARGVETAVQALVHLPDVHLAVVSVPHVAIAPVNELKDLAAELGVQARVHYVNPVEPDEVVAFLSSADVGLIPILRYPSHEMALPNKVFEYVFAGLPVVVSDMPSLTEFVGSTGIGEVFRVEDAADLAAKVRTVLDDPAPYLARVTDPDFRREVSWEGQADKLRELYGQLLGRPLEIPAAGAGTEWVAPTAEQPRLLIGPSNSAGQAWQWATAVERYLPQVRAESLMADTGEFNFRAHRAVPSDQFRTDAAWMVDFASYVLRNVTHVLFEAARPLLGQARGQLFNSDLPTFEPAGITTGLIFHGSEIRDPKLHREWYRYSPFADPYDELTGRLQRACQTVHNAIRDYEGPRFVTTPDLLDFVENGIWLPVVVAVDELRTDRPVLERERPIVVHAPSRSALKGSAFVDPVLQDLHDRGLVEYRRLEGLPHSELMAIIQDSDIVIDQLLLGSYGVAACEAMAAGRVTVGHVADQVRSAIPADLPLVEATPDDLRTVIERIVTERDEAIKSAAAGVDYVQRFHDGRESARVLRGFLGIED
ncbi:glycosyltransferase family 4 protein [Jiangella gansuensis]|uniref:glycosyltransferase family 4 protein n=1 Tax=Jiangella gansuensis TaxID=281473 RepID=UPI0004AEA905|nr:glycosyltransferase family 4 protein [Jiangella gansuensis]